MLKIITRGRKMMRCYKKSLSKGIIGITGVVLCLVQVGSSQNSWNTNGSNIYYNNTEGNVGIGTSTPGAKLEVSTNVTDVNASFLKLLNTNSSGQIALDYYISSSLKGRFRVDHAGNFNVVATDGYISFYTGGDWNGDASRIKMRICNNGNVGIGISLDDPTEKLTVGGSILTYNDIKLGNTGTNGWIIHSNQNGTPAGHEFIIAPSNGAGNYDWNKNFTIHRENGNVGIGDGSSEHAEKLYVNGAVACTKLVIKDWTIEAPDYVFEKDYKLNSLNNVETFINKNKHLPGVPSAKEMKNNGVDLAEMNMKLLQKIEELTIYTIEQNKKIEKLECKIANIKSN